MNKELFIVFNPDSDMLVALNEEELTDIFNDWADYQEVLKVGRYVLQQEFTGEVGVTLTPKGVCAPLTAGSDQVTKPRRKAPRSK